MIFLVNCCLFKQKLSIFLFFLKKVELCKILLTFVAFLLYNTSIISLNKIPFDKRRFAPIAIPCNRSDFLLGFFTENG